MIGAEVQRLGSISPGEWLWVVGMVLLLVAVIVALIARGRGRGSNPLFTLFVRSGDSLERFTGLPAWCAAGLAMGRWALISAAFGFYWDVAWHIDLGRDQQLFTPPHVLILMGLVGIGAAGTLTIIYATAQRVPGMWRVGPLYVPRAGAALLVLGAAATIGFPLDDLWHRTYGIDVTMWSPTHLLMIDAAVLATVALWPLYAEAGPGAGNARTQRWIRITFAAAMAVGLSALQLEFDDSVPQWQILYEPVLIAAAGGVALTAARVAFGRWWALWTALGFVVVRSIIAVLVGGVLQHTTPHFPLYIGMALCVEAGFWLARERTPLVRAVTAGALAGTVGLATEWAWSHIWGGVPWQPSLVQGMWAALLCALAATVLGTAMGGALGGRRALVPQPVLVGAGVLGVLMLAVPFPRSGTDVTATIHATAAGPGTPVIDRLGRLSLAQPVTVSLDVSPADGADNADLFWLTAWQGGGRVTAPLVQQSPGHWVAPGTFPTGGGWKTIVLLARHEVFAAVPVSMPDDPQYGQAAIPASGARVEQFIPASKLLMREFTGGLGTVAVVAYAALGVATVLELLLIVLALRAVARSGPAEPSREVHGRRRSGVTAGVAG